jgi:hypothetical protein
MSMVNGYSYKVQAVAPSNRLQYAGSGVATERNFIVACAYAQDFALRMLGKLYVPGLYETPVLPAKYPMGSVFDNPAVYTSRVKMRAATFNIEPFNECCFTGVYELEREDDTVISKDITDPEFLLELERNFPIELQEGGSGNYLVGGTCACLCKVTIGYVEQPWDCAYPDVDVLANTALSIERSAGYEMFTLPNRNLRWADIVADDEVDAQLKGDTYASIIVPKSDITVTWHNVPVKRLCEIEAHLTKFRGCVNKCDFTLLSQCLCDATDTESESCDSTVVEACQFEAETVLFIDWSEDKQARTRGFYKMDTTNLTLHFKQKRAPFAANGVAGWNHLYLDRSGSGALAAEPWQRVVVERGDNSDEPLFKMKNFDNIFNLGSAEPVPC